MALGLCNSPATFEIVVDVILLDFIRSLMCLDDIIVF